jgi:hypothetical protein
LGLGQTQSKKRKYPDGKITKKNNKKRLRGKGFKTNSADGVIINTSKVYETRSEQLTSFGWLLFLIKFFNLTAEF